MAVFLFFIAFIIALSCLAFWRFPLSPRNRTKEWFLVANRNIGLLESVFSIAASWIWAPALFVSSQKAYEQGLLGFLWFLIPNVLSLLLFSIFAVRIRRQFPFGITLSDYIRCKYSTRVQIVYWIGLTGLAICAFAIQLLAVARLLSLFYSASFFWVTLILGLTPLIYSTVFGFKGSILSDYGKMLLVLGLGSILVPMAFIRAGGSEIYLSGLMGKIGTIHFFSKESSQIFWSFGLPVSIGLLSGPFGDQTFWQRAFAIKKQYVGCAFFLGGLVFAIVPLMMSTFGFLAVGLHLSSSRPEFIGFEVALLVLPAFAQVALLVLVFSGLLSILDSKLASISSLAGHDFFNKFWKHGGTLPGNSLFYSKLAMVLLALLGIVIANIPGLKILHLFLFYGTLRSATFLPTLLTILKVQLWEPGVFYGILLGIFVGLPIFAFGNLRGNSHLIVTGSLISVLSPALISLMKRTAPKLQPLRE